MANFDMWPPHFSLWPPLGEGGSDPPLRVIRTAAEPRARALGAPPPPCRQTTSWQPMIAKLAGMVPKVTLSNPCGSVSLVPGKTESFAPMLLALLFRDYLAQPLRFKRHARLGTADTAVLSGQCL